MKKSIYSEQGVVFRKWLKQQRIDAKLTKRDLAQRIDVPFQLISKIEKGERRLYVVEYVMYCQALMVDPRDGILLIEREC